ncbi:hypothetical protein [Mitsuaria sp. GD03876]|uniref:hypothetical protein n=1 Tax=Mitsuaria sp. GD03876 TaxID=2975399 RepID=UPI00244CF169|nr:hypothetical protein [Mitsuaria sp. GD03876]MDH0864685.1 hypothetical protein [Mitsuaria sp. GD03876]
MSAALSSTAGIRGRMHAPNARAAGLILVGIVHLLMVGALVKGFQRHVSEAPPPIQMRAIDEPRPKPPEPVVIDVPPPPTQVMPKAIQVPVPEVAIDSTVPPVVRTEAATEARDDGFKIAETRKTEDPPAKPARDAVQPPGAICTQMAAPEMPAVNWSGEALFRAVAEVQGGRVVAVQIQALGGAMDARTRRAFSNAIEGTLKSRYVCPGGNRFQQDFAFRMD